MTSVFSLVFIDRGIPNVSVALSAPPTGIHRQFTDIRQQHLPCYMAIFDPQFFETDWQREDSGTQKISGVPYRNRQGKKAKT
jgi:hypothetical protein